MIRQGFIARSDNSLFIILYVLPLSCIFVTMEMSKESKSESTSKSGSIKQKRAVKRKRNSKESDLQELQPKNKKKKGNYGFLGQPDHKKFTDGIPFYIPTKAYYQLVAELTNKSQTGTVNSTVVAVFDMSGVGKTTFFKEAAEAAQAYCFALNTSAAGPFVSLHDAAKSLINPFFSNGSASVEDVMPKLEFVFNHAFAIVLSEIKDHLTKGLDDGWCLLTINGLHDAVNSGVIPNPQSLMADIATMLNGRPAIILNDEIQLFATHLTTIKTNSLPSAIYEEYDKQQNHFGWKDFLIVAFYRALFSLALIGRKHNILFCQAGTYNLENIYIHSPCKPIESINSCLPLELFDMNKCKTLFDHFWHFKITNKEKEDLLGQLLGPPKLMEYFFNALATIEKSPDNVTHEDLQKAVDRAIATLENTISLRLYQVAGAYETYVRIVLYPEDYGGEVENGRIVYQPHTEGFRILQEKGSSFADSSVLRLHRGQEQDIVVEMPSRATQLVMSHILFSTRKQQYNNLVAILNNKVNAFETLLLFEFCEPTSPLYKRIEFATEPKISFTAGDYTSFTNFTEVLNKEEDFIAKIEDIGGGHSQGAHKIDVVCQLGNSFVAIQAVCQDFSKAKSQQNKLNTKLCEAVMAFATHVGDIASTDIVFVFASMFDFKVTDTTKKLIAKQQNFKVIVLTDFEGCIFPFYMLLNKAKLTDGVKIRELIKLFYQRLTGKPAPLGSIDFFSNSATSDVDPTKNAYSKLYELSKVLEPSFNQKLYDILGDKLHPKRTPLLILLNSSHSIEQLKVKLKTDF